MGPRDPEGVGLRRRSAPLVETIRYVRYVGYIAGSRRRSAPVRVDHRHKLEDEAAANLFGARVVLVKQEAQAALQDVRCGRLTWGCNGR